LLAVIVLDVVNQFSLANRFEAIQTQVSTNTNDIKVIVDFINKNAVPAK
jgi:hypothetical protein